MSNLTAKIKNPLKKREVFDDTLILECENAVGNVLKILNIKYDEILCSTITLNTQLNEFQTLDINSKIISFYEKGNVFDSIIWDSFKDSSNLYINLRGVQYPITSFSIDPESIVTTNNKINFEVNISCDDFLKELATVNEKVYRVKDGFVKNTESGLNIPGKTFLGKNTPVYANGIYFLNNYISEHNGSFTRPLKFSDDKIYFFSLNPSDTSGDWIFGEKSVTVFESDILNFNANYTKNYVNDYIEPTIVKGNVEPDEILSPEDFIGEIYRLDKEPVIKYNIISGDDNPEHPPSEHIYIQSMDMNFDVSGETKIKTNIFYENETVVKEIIEIYGYKYYSKDLIVYKYINGKFSGIELKGDAQNYWDIIESKTINYNFDSKTGYYLGKTITGWSYKRYSPETNEKLEYTYYTLADDPRSTYYEFIKVPIQEQETFKLLTFESIYKDSMKISEKYIILKKASQVDPTKSRTVYKLNPYYNAKRFVAEKKITRKDFEVLVLPDYKITLGYTDEGEKIEFNPILITGSENFEIETTKIFPSNLTTGNNSDYLLSSLETLGEDKFITINRKISHQDYNFENSIEETTKTETTGRPSEALKKNLYYSIVIEPDPSKLFKTKIAVLNKNDPYTHLVYSSNAPTRTNLEIEEISNVVTSVVLSTQELKNSLIRQLNTNKMLNSNSFSIDLHLDDYTKASSYNIGNKIKIFNMEGIIISNSLLIENEGFNFKANSNTPYQQIKNTLTLEFVPIIEPYVLTEKKIPSSNPLAIPQTIFLIPDNTILESIGLPITRTRGNFTP
jgi:hypothetical protein